MSYQEEQSFEFEPGTSIISAKNGSGKSSIVEALFFGFFGKPYRKINKDDLINDKTLKNLEVTLEFKINNKNFKIIRGQKPAKFEIYENDELIVQDAKSLDYQKMLEENIIKTNENIFRQLVLIGANIPNSKNFSELTNKEREDLFKFIIDIGIFGEYSDLAKGKIKEMKNEFSLIDSKLSQLLNLEQKLKADIKRQEDSNATFEESREQKLQEQYTFISAQKETLEKIAKGLDLLLIDGSNDFSQIGILKQALQELSSNDNLISQKRTMISKLKESHHVCIGCEKLKDISGIDITEEDSLFTESLKISEKKTKVKEALGRLEEAKSAQDEKIKKRDSLILKQNEIQNSIINAEEKIKIIQDVQPSVIDYSSLESIKEEEKNLLESKVNLENRIRDFATFVELLSDKNLKGQILDLSLPVINKYINYFLEKFGNFPYLFTINNNLTETIMTIDGSNIEKSFNSLSNGQKLRIVFSILFAFLKFTEERNVSHFNVLFLDEVLDSSIDMDGRAEMINILRNEFNDKSINIISHTQDLQEAEELFDYIYQVQRENIESGSKILTLKGK